MLNPIPFGPELPSIAYANRESQADEAYKQLRWILRPQLSMHAPSSFTVRQAHLASEAITTFLEAYVATGSLNEAAIAARTLTSSVEVGIEKAIEASRIVLGEDRNPTWWSSVAPKPERKPRSNQRRDNGRNRVRRMTAAD